MRARRGSARRVHSPYAGDIAEHALRPGRLRADQQPRDRTGHGCVGACLYAGAGYAADSWRIAEHSNVTANGPPVYHFKTVIPIAGALVMLQGVAEIVRCVICLKTGEWPSRLKDVAEMDVVGEQLANSQYVDEESRKVAIEKAKDIDETARQRGMGGDLNK